MSDVNLNKVGHYKEGNSDKVYIASIVPVVVDAGQAYKVVGKAGRIYKNVTVYDKGLFYSIQVAEAERDKLFASKVKKGYVNIESPAYMHELDCNDKWLLDNVEPDPNFNNNVFSNHAEMTVDYIPDMSDDSTDEVYDDFEVLCLDANGMEDKFDFDVTYIAEKHDDPDLLYVWDRNGIKQECFAERFSIMEESAV